MPIQQLFLGAGQFLVDSADFDGTDSMARGGGLTGAADSKSGILSFWVRFDGGNGSAMYAIFGTALHFGCLKNTSNIIQVVGRNAANTVILTMSSATAYTAGATWYHVLASWDLSTGAGNLYINDVNDLAGGATLTDDSIDYTVADWNIGAGVGNLNGCLAELYFAPGQYLDISVEANRRKFISPLGKPVILGSTGAFPTGTAAIAYQHLANAEAVANFAINRGTGGDFSITGTLTTGSTSPSD